ALGGERQELAIRRPVGLRVDKAVRLVVAADPRLQDTPLRLARGSVSQIEINEVEVLLAEVRDLGPVRRERRSEVQGALGELLRQQRLCDGACLRPGTDLGQILLQNGVTPLSGELVHGKAD